MRKAVALVVLRVGIHASAGSEGVAAPGACEDVAAAHHRDGMAHLEREEPGKASSAFVRAIQDCPAFHPALRGLADLDLRRGRLDRAVEWLDRAISLQPENVDYHCLLALIHIQAERNQEALAAAREALRLNPESVDAHYLLGLSHERLHAIPEARSSYQRALALNPEYAAAHFLLGSLYGRDQATFRQAAGHLKKALSLGLSRPDVLKGLGSVLVKLEEYDEAVRILDRALQLSPDDSELHYLLATSCRRLGETARAESALEEYRVLAAAERESRDAGAAARAHYNTGMKHYLKDEAELAYDSLSRAVEKVWYMDRALYRLALIDLERGAPGRAAQWIRTAIRVKSKEARYHFVLARTLESTQPTAALEAVQEALDLDFAEPDFHNLLGNLLFSDGRDREAVEAYRNAAALDPQAPLVHLNLASALERMGAVEEAAAAKSRYRELAARRPGQEANRK